VISDRGGLFSALRAEALITYHLSLITRFGARGAGKSLADGLGPTFGRGDPRTVDPRRIVPDMLLVPAFEPGYPMSFVVLAKANDAAIRHCWLTFPAGQG
jgi:hypothetical protein